MGDLTDIQLEQLTTIVAELSVQQSAFEAAVIQTLVEAGLTTFVDFGRLKAAYLQRYDQDMAMCKAMAMLSASPLGEWMRSNKIYDKELGEFLESLDGDVSGHES